MNDAYTRRDAAEEAVKRVGDSGPMEPNEYDETEPCYDEAAEREAATEKKLAAASPGNFTKPVSMPDISEPMDPMGHPSLPDQVDNTGDYAVAGYYRPSDYDKRCAALQVVIQVHGNIGRSADHLISEAEKFYAFLTKTA